MTSRIFAACAPLLLCAACSGDGDAPSAEQDRDMNEAAEMLEKAPGSLANIDESALEQSISDQPAGNAVTDGMTE